MQLLNHYTKCHPYFFLCELIFTCLTRLCWLYFNTLIITNLIYLNTYFLNTFFLSKILWILIFSEVQILMLWFCCPNYIPPFFLRLSYLSESDTERRTEREIIHPMIHSQNSCKGHVQMRLKPGDQSFFLISIIGLRTQVLNPISVAPPRYISRDRK